MSITKLAIQKARAGLAWDGFEMLEARCVMPDLQLQVRAPWDNHALSEVTSVFVYLDGVALLELPELAQHPVYRIHKLIEANPTAQEICANVGEQGSLSFAVSFIYKDDPVAA